MFFVFLNIHLVSMQVGDTIVGLSLMFFSYNERERLKLIGRKNIKGFISYPINEDYIIVDSYNVSIGIIKSSSCSSCRMLLIEKI